MGSTSQDAMKAIRIYGHVSATPEKFATIFGGTTAHEVDSTCDVAIFAINPSAGIDNRTIELWRGFDEYQTPRLVVVTVMDGLEMDFDDAVLLANRVFDELVTPYLVLHGENGMPIGTISLQDLTTVDYSTTPPTKSSADDELQEIVKDFRDEYLDQMIEMEEGAFAAGILFPAIPVNPANGLGVDLAQKYLEELPSSR
jgi:translation elongation factor EF-G